MEDNGFKEYVASRQRSLLRTAWLLTGDWHHSEDLVQIALLKVWRRWTQVVGGGDPDAYVRRTLVNCFMTWRRRYWHGERPMAQDRDAPIDEHSFTAVEMKDLLLRMLPTLTARQRAVLVLRFYEDLSVEQTAELLGCSRGTVKSQTAKALTRLRRIELTKESR